MAGKALGHPQGALRVPLGWDERSRREVTCGKGRADWHADWRSHTHLVSEAAVGLYYIVSE